MSGREYLGTIVVIVHGRSPVEHVHTTFTGSKEKDILNFINQQAKEWWDTNRSAQLNSRTGKWVLFSTSAGDIRFNCPRFKDLKTQPKIHVNNGGLSFKAIIGPEEAVRYWRGTYAAA